MTLGSATAIRAFLICSLVVEGGGGFIVPRGIGLDGKGALGKGGISPLREPTLEAVLSRLLIRLAICGLDSGGAGRSAIV